MTIADILIYSVEHITFRVEALNCLSPVRFAGFITDYIFYCSRQVCLHSFVSLN